MCDLFKWTLTFVCDLCEHCLKPCTNGMKPECLIVTHVFVCICVISARLEAQERPFRTCLLQD